MDYETLSVSFDAPVARITLARAEVGNRIGLRTLRELAGAAEAVDAREDVALVVLAAEGADFCAGWDSDVLSPADVGLDPFGCLSGLAVPVLGFLHGQVASAGLELALACDLRVAREDARFSCPEVARGGIPLAGATARLPRIVGRTVASGMLLLGDELDAAAADRCGLVSRVVPADGFESEAAALAVRITANGPIALRYAKEAILNGIELPLDQALRYELDLSIILQTTHDRAEGVRAFLEKRPPKFEGR